MLAQTSALQAHAPSTIKEAWLEFAREGMMRAEVTVTSSNLKVVLLVLQEPTFNDANAVRTLVSPRKVPVVHMHNSEHGVQISQQTS